MWAIMWQGPRCNDVDQPCSVVPHVRHVTLLADMLTMTSHRTCWNTLFFLLSVLSHCSCPMSFDRQWAAWIRRAAGKWLACPGETWLHFTGHGQARAQLLFMVPLVCCLAQPAEEVTGHAGSSSMHSTWQAQQALSLSGQSRHWTPYLGLKQTLFWTRRSTTTGPQVKFIPMPLRYALCYLAMGCYSL